MFRGSIAVMLWGGEVWRAAGLGTEGPVWVEAGVHVWQVGWRSSHLFSLRRQGQHATYSQAHLGDYLQCSKFRINVFIDIMIMGYYILWLISSQVLVVHSKRSLFFLTEYFLFPGNISRITEVCTISIPRYVTIFFAVPCEYWKSYR